MEKIAARGANVVSVGFEAANDYDLGEIKRKMKVIEQEAAQKPDVIFTCECWTGFGAPPEPPDGPATQMVSEAAAKYGVYIASPVYRADEQGRKLNSVQLFDRSGRLVFTYDKLYPFLGEFMDIPEGMQPAYPGKKAAAYDCDFGRIAFAICFDSNFP
ncbi:MAG: hypothetical protein FWF03_06595, partial [Defluviitaleaceae bacterium]|nr:hypothetical protein [Defluviitaleaceae bacterium]